MTIFDFGKGVPKCFKTKGGFLSVTTSVVKQGTGSLKWDFSYGDKLIINTDIGYKKLIPDGKDFRVYVFGMYLFGFGAEGSLHLGFMKGGVEQTGFDAELGFKNWRSITACFDRDMTGQATEGMDALIITANSEGTLLLSELITAGRVDQRHILKSYQVPFINNNELLIIKDWKVPEKYSHIKPDEKTASLIKQRALKYIASEFTQTVPGEFEELQKRVDRFEIRECEYGITGKRVEWYNQRRIVDDTPLKDDEFVSLRTVTNLMQDISVFYLKTKDKRAADLYLSILKYIIVQGFSEGSSFGTHKILDYGIRPFYASAIAMYDVIEQNGLTEEITNAMLWFLHAPQRGFADGIPMKKASSDDFFNSARGLLYAILMMKDITKQAQLLAAYSDWVSQSLDIRSGLCGMFKEDGCIFHHHGHYICYAKGGLSGITPIVYMLSGTAFEITDEAFCNLKKVIYALDFQCNGTYVPIALSGRHPTDKEVLDPVIFKYFALSALEKGDTESAGVYLNIKDKPDDEYDKKTFELAAENVNVSGNKSYPYACCNVHKRKDFMAISKGYSKYLWGSEIYKADNLYGRYRSYGVVEIINGKSGFSHDGYNWSRFPGATAINLPLDDLKADVRNVDDKSGFEEMLLSDQSFAGSVSLGDNGMFSMILSEHPKYCGSHKARKSVFLHDDFILLLGSGISNDSTYETETTLYQISLDAFQNSHTLNGEVKTGTFRIKENDILKDNCGNNYYIKPGTSIFLSSGEQISRHSENCSETSGKFSCAVINHGVSPKDASYEYGIGINGAEKPGYAILRQDDSVHAVKIGNTTYMAIFEPENCDTVSVNVPILLMIEELKDTIEFAICDPDLHIYDEDSSQFDENGVQKEVSIYSRVWVTNPIGTQNIKLSVPQYEVDIDLDIKCGITHKFSKERKVNKND